MRRLLLAILVIYGGSYLAFRSMHTQVWDEDRATYVIFPESGPGQALYYLWRPLSYLDQRLTGTGSHIGPHR